MFFREKIDMKEAKDLIVTEAEELIEKVKYNSNNDIKNIISNSKKVKN